MRKLEPENILAKNPSAAIEIRNCDSGMSAAIASVADTVLFPKLAALQDRPSANHRMAVRGSLGSLSPFVK